MTLRDLINKLLGRETASANTARERLQLVLAHDRVDMSSLTTDLLDKMRKEILDVVASNRHRASAVAQLLAAFG